jgi:hypothetical protein
VGIRTPLFNADDYETDEEVGFNMIEAEEVEDVGGSCCFLI